LGQALSCNLKLHPDLVTKPREVGRRRLTSQPPATVLR
jgi:hypothetical protein